MPLTPGTRLGSYTITAPLGSGGMGEVYRARDGKLDRDVALKILPPHLAADPEARARFEREAKAVAALSHPNILAIHDFGSDGGTAFAVAELLEGETLRARLAGGPLPAKTVVRIATEIAHGLAAAHDKLIAHRDLKPENVFIASDGRVKILDFGLARHIGPQSSSASDSPTELRPTDPGVVMGTVGYMSPEQVKGQAVDARSDLFSLGCVLFEMASGQPPFRRATAAETMTAILRDDPPDLPAGTAAMPGALEPVIRHCLEKRPEERFQSARDLAFALQSVAAPAPSGGVTPAATGVRPRRRVGAATALVVAALTGVAAFVAGRSSSGARDASIGPVAMAFDQITDFPGVESNPTLSPDAKTVVYVGSGAGNLDLYALRVGGRAPVLLTGDSSADDFQPAFSPDGERLAFHSERDGGGIFVMGATGESVRKLATSGFSPSWSPTGREIVVSTGTFSMPTERASSSARLAVIDVASGQTRVVLKDADAVQPSWSPHGTRIAYWGLRAGGQRDLWTVAADGSESANGGVAITSDPPLDWSPTWAPDGRALYFSSNRGGTYNLWRVPIDEATGRTLGPPEPMTTPSTFSGYYSVSKDGAHIAFASLDWRSALLKVPFDGLREAITGPAVPILKSTRPIRDHEISPDGQWIAFMESGRQEDVLVARLDGTQSRRLTDDAFRDRGPSWSPDSRRIAFYSDRSGSYQLWTISLDGMGLQHIPTEPLVNYPIWSPDGRQIAFSSTADRSVWGTLDMSASNHPFTAGPQMGDGLGFWPQAWSHDGTQLVGTVRKSSGIGAGLATFTIATGTYQFLPSPSFWQTATWLSDGRRLVVRDDTGVAIVHPDTGTRKPLFRIGGILVGRSVGMTPDGKWITYTETGTEGDIWMALLKR